MTESGGLYGSRALLIAGLAVFLIAKLYLVVPFTWLAGAPRQGDDSYVYLWKGVLASRYYDASSPALSDIRSFALDTANDGTESISRPARVVMRSQGGLSPFHDYAASKLFAASGDAKWTIGILEVGGIIFMAVALAALLSVLYGSGAAGIGLILMAFAVLPNQGISHFIPSTLTLSLGMLAWAFALRPSSGRLAAAATISALLSGLHPIGKLYGALTVVFHGVNVWRGESGFRLPHWIVLASVVGIALSVFTVLPLIVLALAPPPTTHLGGVSAIGGILVNLSGVGAMLWETLKRNPHIFAITALGLALATRRRLPCIASRVALMVLLGMCCSLLHFLPGYPAELFSRLLVLAVILLSGYAGFLALGAIKGSTRPRRWAAVAVLLMVPNIVYWFSSYAFTERRPFVINDEMVRAELSLLPEKAALLYIDSDISLMVALMNGAEVFGAIPMPMINSDVRLRSALSEKRPVKAIVQMPDALNTVTAYRVRKFASQNYGFLFSATDRLSLQAEAGGPLSDIYALVRNTGPELKVQIKAKCVARCSEHALARGVPVPANSYGWIPLWKQEDAVVTSLAIELPNTDAWLVGLRSSPDDARVHWPWNEQWKTEFHMRNRAADRIETLTFSVRELLDWQNATRVLDFIAADHPVVSDVSGLVFLDTIYARPRH